MTNSEALNNLVTEMAKQKGYAYTTGYLQSVLMDIISATTKKQQVSINADLLRTLRMLQESA